MIDPYAIEDFMNRDLRDCSSVKKWSRKKLERALQRYAVVEPILRPRDYQLPGIYLGLRFGSMFLSYDMGLGKSKICIDIFRNLRKAKQVTRQMVLVPGTGNISQWYDELKIHDPGSSVAGLEEGMPKETREKILWESKARTIVLTYSALQSLVCGVQLKPDGTVQRTRGGNSRRPIPKLVKRLSERFQMVCCDESSAFKNHTSVTFSVLKMLAPLVKYRYCLSGTPFSSDPIGIWSQMWFVDMGETLGDFGMFREAFFVKKKTETNPWGAWVLKDAQGDELHRVIANRSIRFDETECLDLPSRVGGYRRPMIRAATLPPQQLSEVTRVYDEMREQHVLDLSISEMSTPEAKPLYYQLRSISSGYLPTEHGKVLFAKNPKLENLMQLLDEIGDEKSIVFIHYKSTREIIEQALKQRKIKFACVVGGVKNKGQEIEKFRGSARVLICSLAGAYGLNLQFCRNMIFFESPDSIAARRQAEARIARQGQKMTCHFWDMITHGTYDKKILKNLRQRGHVLSRVVDGRDDKVS